MCIKSVKLVRYTTFLGESPRSPFSDWLVGVGVVFHTHQTPWVWPFLMMLNSPQQLRYKDGSTPFVLGGGGGGNQDQPLYYVRAKKRDLIVHQLQIFHITERFTVSLQPKSNFGTRFVEPSHFFSLNMYTVLLFRVWSTELLDTALLARLFGSYTGSFLLRNLALAVLCR